MDFMNKPTQAAPSFIADALASASLGKAAACALTLAAVLALNPAHAADAANGKLLAAAHNCAACHGANLNSPVSPEYPKLAGQHADYIYWALRQYQMGNDNPLLGRSNPIMRAQVQTLSQSDLRDLAAYIESLPGDLVNKK
jgi:cytochrome c553